MKNKVTTGQLCERLLCLLCYCTYKAHMEANFRQLDSWCTDHPYEVGKILENRTKLEVTMYSKYTAHISSNGSHFLMTEFLVYLTYNI